METLGNDVQSAVHSAVEAVVDADQDLAASIILGDHPINRATRDLDRRCHAFVARHLPSAGHLRFISSVMRILVAVERTGDYAVTVCRETLQINNRPTPEIIKDIREVGAKVEQAFAKAMLSFVKGDVDLARESVEKTGETRSESTNVFEDLAQAAEQGSLTTREAMALLVVLNRLERVGDQAKNICEETVFATTGETKHPKVYRVLFVDHTGARLAKMAECIARKGFPESGEFSSAGIEPAAEFDPQVASFLDERGHSLQGDAPTGLASSLKDLADFHVVIDLKGGLRTKLEGIPFHTVLVRWELTPGDELEPLYGQLSGYIRELMETLRGEDAS